MGTALCIYKHTHTVYLYKYACIYLYYSLKYVHVCVCIYICSFKRLFCRRSLFQIYQSRRGGCGGAFARLRRWCPAGSPSPAWCRRLWWPTARSAGSTQGRHIMMLQKISISNKCCPFQLYIHQRFKVSTRIWSSTTVFNIDDNQKYL